MTCDTLDNYKEINWDEETTGNVTATLNDRNGDPIPAASLVTMVATLVETVSGDIINTRDNQDVLNANDVTVHPTSGLVTWSVQAEDTEIVGTTAVGSRESHLMTITATSANEQVHMQILLKVRNLMSVPQGS